MAVCVAVRLVLFTISSVFVVIATDLPPSIHGPPRDTALQTNASTILRCVVSSDTHVNWYRGSLFTTFELVSYEHVITFSESLLVGRFRNRHHGGEYMCKASMQSQALYSCPGVLSHARIESDFVAEPSDTTLSIGTTAVLICTPPYSNPPSVVAWLKDGNPITITSQYTVSDDGNLYLFNVTKEDAGFYQCTAWNSITDKVRHSRRAHILIDDNNFEVEQEFIIVPRNRTIIMGDSLELECADNLGSEIQWEWIGHESLPLSIIDPSTGTLLILGTPAAVDGGVFECTTGNLTARAHVTVVAPPKAILSGSSLSGPAGSTVNLSCTNKSPVSQEVDIVWQIGGIVFKMDNSVSESNFSVVLPDEGELWVQCMMRNSYGCYEEAVTLSVESKTALITVSPKFLDLSTQNSNQLTCTVSGPGIISYDWSSQTQDVSNQQTKLEQGEDSKLSLLYVTQPGIYTCQAVIFQNGQLNIIEESAIVIAAQPSTITSTTTTATTTMPTTTSPPSLTTSSTTVPTKTNDPSPLVSVSVTPSVVNEFEGSRVTVKCVAKLATFVFWEHSNEAAVFEQETSFIGDETVNEVTIESLTKDHEGTLKCIALSTTGTAEASVIITVKGPLVSVSVTPSVVNEFEGSRVTVKCVAKLATFVLWEHSNEAAVFEQETNFSDDEIISEVVIDSLTRDHKGTLKCVALDSTSSNAEASVIIKVKDAPPTHAPSNVSLFWLDDTTLLIAWATPTNNDNTLGYKLTWDVIERQLRKVALWSVPVGTNQLTITNLKRDSIYNVMVWPYSLNGDGPVTVMTSTDAIVITEAPATTAEPSDPPLSVFEINQCTALLPTLGYVTLGAATQLEIGGSVVVNYTCLSSSVTNTNVYGTLGLSLFTDVPILLSELTPNCSYLVVVSSLDSAGNIASQTECNFNTSLSEVLALRFSWDDNNNNLVLTWDLPQSLKDIATLVVEMNYNGNWIEIQSPISNPSFNFSPLQTVDIRMRLSTIVIYQETIIVPNLQQIQSPSPSPSISSIGTTWLTYTVGFGAVLLSIIAALSLILVLKHIQNNRRERNKVINHKRPRVHSQSSQKSLFTRDDLNVSLKKLSVMQTSNI